YGVPRGSMVSYSSSVSMSAKPPWPSTWQRKDGRPRKAGRPSCAHADGIVAMDMFVVPTVSFRLLYGLLILQHARRELLWLWVTAHPSAQWVAQQLTEAFGWKDAPRYLIRDRDCVYGDAFIRRVGVMGIRDRSVSARSPWQNGYVERLI